MAIYGYKIPIFEYNNSVSINNLFLITMFSLKDYFFCYGVIAIGPTRVNSLVLCKGVARGLVRGCAGVVPRLCKEFLR